MERYLLSLLGGATLLIAVTGAPIARVDAQTSTPTLAPTATPTNTPTPTPIPTVTIVDVNERVSGWDLSDGRRCYFWQTDGGVWQAAGYMEQP